MNPCPLLTSRVGFDWEVHIELLPTVDAFLWSNYEANKKTKNLARNVPRGGVLANSSILLRISTITSIDSPEPVGIAS